MPSVRHPRRTAQRPALPRVVPEDLPGWSWAQNGAGELALVAPGGESTPWFLREAETRAGEAARAYLAERPQLVACHAEAATVAQLGWVARALPAAGWELHERGPARTRLATDDAGLHTAAAVLQAAPGLSLRALATEVTAAGGMAALVGDDLEEATQPDSPAEQDLPLPAPDGTEQPVGNPTLHWAWQTLHQALRNVASDDLELNGLADLRERAAALGMVVAPPEEPGGRCRVVPPVWDGRSELRLTLDDLAQQLTEWETAAASRAGALAISGAVQALVERARALGAVVDVLDGATLHVLPPERVGGVDQWLTPAGLERQIAAWEAPAETVRLELPAFDRQAFQLEWGLVQQALDDIGAAATLELLHAAQTRLGEAQGERQG